jgi:hypothetical protein
MPNSQDSGTHRVDRQASLDRAGLARAQGVLSRRLVPNTRRLRGSGHPVMVSTAFALVMAGLAACSAGSGPGGVSVGDVVEQPPEAEHQRLQEQIEEDKRACMAEEGFRYIPHPQPRYEVSSSKAQLRGALITARDRAWVETYGYGLTAGLTEANEWFYSNPNVEIQRSLDRAESESYSEAFDRCAIRAQEDAGIDISGEYLELSMQVKQLVGELEEVIVSDPRLAEATERWTECMNERGYSYTLLSDPRDDIATRVYSLMPDTWEEAEKLYSSVSDEELSLAIDDLDCREASGVDDVLPVVIEEVDADFVDRHAELLARYSAIRIGS